MYLAVGDFLVTRAGEQIELLACNVIELESNEAVGVQRALTPSEARALGAALIAAANGVTAANATRFELKTADQ